MLTTIFLLVTAGLTSFIFHFTENKYNDTTLPDLPEPTDSPTFNPSTPNRWRAIMDRIGDLIIFDSSVDPNSVFKDQSTPQYRAFDWLANNDAYRVDDLESISDQELVDRYALAVLYYTDLGLTWNKQLNFLEPISVCSWNNRIDSKDENAAGVYCSENIVTFLQLGMYRIFTIERQIGCDSFVLIVSCLVPILSG
jgi:hypothetical protein